jgi:hypothetical protein
VSLTTILDLLYGTNDTLLNSNIPFTTDTRPRLCTLIPTTELNDHIAGAGFGLCCSTAMYKCMCGPKTNGMFDMLTEINSISDVRYGLLIILALSSLSVYGLIIAG